MPKPKPNVFDGQKITASEFFKTHWQRLPYLFTDTKIDLSCLPDVKMLFELAAKEDVQSRIVFTEDGHQYQAIYDQPEAWKGVKNFKPSLLVSDIEKWYPKANQILAAFPFIKNWRFDDFMMSFAPTGSSVGAHTDHYDVFLVQVQGSRRWSYDHHPLDQTTLVKDSELAVLDHYTPQVSQELKAGDVLYIPPEIPHHGVSTSDDCITCSIGLRAPSQAELITALLDAAIQDKDEKARFKDAVQSIQQDASIGSHEIGYLRQQLESLNGLSDRELAECFGRLVTGYRLLDDERYDDQPTTQIQNTNLWEKSPFAVFAFHRIAQSKAHLFVNGETYVVEQDFAESICNSSQFMTPNSDAGVFTQLVEARALILI